MADVYGIPVESVITGLAIIVLLMLIMMIVIWIRLGKWKKRYRSMMGGLNAGQLEEAIIQFQQKAQMLERNDRHQEQELTRLHEKIAAMRGNVELIRYNAFSEHGSDLSFSVAFLNELQQGVVLSGIHSREQTFVYAKPVDKGQSPYTLTPEEKRVIDQAAGKAAPAPTRAAAR